MCKCVDGRSRQLAAVQLSSSDMVYLELQASASSGQRTFHEIDPVAALQQFQSQRSPASGQIRSPKTGSVKPSSFFSSSKDRPAIAEQQAPQRVQHSHTIRSKTGQHNHSNDGMRLSDFGEEPLAINTPHSPFHKTAVDQQDTTSDQQDSSADNQASFSGRSVADADVALDVSMLSTSKHTDYICSTKDDPLVKGR